MDLASLLQSMFGGPTPLPKLRRDIEVVETPLEAGGIPQWFIYDPIRNQYFRLSFVGAELLRYWNDVQTIDDLAKLVSEKTVLKLDKKTIENFTQFLIASNLTIPEGVFALGPLYEQKQKAKHSIFTDLVHNYLFIRLPLLKPDLFLEKTLPYVRWLFSRTFLIFLGIIFVIGFSLVLRQENIFRSSFLHFFTWEGLLSYSFTIWIFKVAHEFGHAYALKLAGGRVPSMGLAFLVMAPVLYTDTTDSWRITSRRHKVMIDVAGMVVELTLSTFALFLWNFVDDGPFRSSLFFAATTSWVMTLSVNLNPMMRFDGYYLFQDLLGIENLQTAAFDYARWNLREWFFKLNLPPPEPVTPHKRLIYLSYSYIVWTYRFFLYMGIATMVYYHFFKLLGIYLFIIEVVFFLAGPFFREFTKWWKLREHMTLNRHSITFWSFTLTIFMLLLLPWNKTVSIPAIYKAAETYKVYAPEAAQIQKIYVKQGDIVQKGDLLIEMTSPKLEQEKQQAELSLKQYSLQSENAIASKDILEESIVILREQETNRQKLEGILETIEQLQIRAPIDGVISTLPEDYKLGHWVAKKELMMYIYQPNRLEVTGYAQEQDIERLKAGDKGLFIPESFDIDPKPIILESYSTKNMDSLDTPLVASLYGGGVDVVQQKGQLIPQTPTYLVRMVSTKSSEENINVERELRGVVKLRGRSQSIFITFLKNVARVIIRESGF